MENLPQNCCEVTQGQGTLDMVNTIKEEPCDSYCRDCQAGNVVMSDKDIKTECVDPVHDENETEVSKSAMGSTSECLTARKSEKAEDCETNFILENGVGDMVMIPKLIEVKKEQPDDLVASDNSSCSEDSHDFNSDEKVELLKRKSDNLTEKLRTVCRELRKKEAEMGVAPMRSPNSLHTDHTSPWADSCSDQVKVEPETGNEGSGILSCDMCHLAFPQPVLLLKNMRRVHHNGCSEQSNNSEITESFHGKESNTAIARGSGIVNSTPATDHCHQVQRLEIKNVICVNSLSVENHVTEENTGQVVVQDCSMSSTPDIKQFQSIQSCSKIFVVKDNNYENSDSGDRQECDHLQGNIKMRTGKKSYNCDVCGVDFGHGSHLRVHKRIHTGKRLYKCDVCGVDFVQSSALKVHKRVHTGERPYNCVVCGMDFKSSSGLQLHKRIHTGEKPYRCDVCGVGFTRVDSLKQHKRTHTGERPYKCDVCGVGFARVDSLKQHKRTHTGERPYKCDVCGVGFIQNSHLKVHKRVHTGEKPYNCVVCGMSFKSSAGLQCHKRIHTGQKPYKCDVGGVGFAQVGTLNSTKEHTQGRSLTNVMFVV